MRGDLTTRQTPPRHKSYRLDDRRTSSPKPPKVSEVPFATDYIYPANMLPTKITDFTTAGIPPSPRKSPGYFLQN